MFSYWASQSVSVEACMQTCNDMGLNSPGGIKKLVCPIISPLENVLTLKVVSVI